MLTNKRVSIIVGALIALAFISHAPSVWVTLGNLRMAQIESNERFESWRLSYEALLPVNDVWVSTYPASVVDLMELYQRVNLEKHGLAADVDTIMQTDAQKVEVRGFDVGLSKLCIGSGGWDASIRLSSASAISLKDGIEGLAKRKDIEMGSMTFAFDKQTNRPYVDVNGLCLRVRSDA